MSDCCSKSKQKYQRHTCPECHKACSEVPYKTILYHVKSPWKLSLTEQSYYFCGNPDCDMVYVGDDNSTIGKDQLRTNVGTKDKSEDSLICYCFGISRAAAATDVKAKAFVIEQTKNAICSCSTHNPSGKCCLKEFPKDSF